MTLVCEIAVVGGVGVGAGEGVEVEGEKGAVWEGRGVVVFEVRGGAVLGPPLVLFRGDGGGECAGGGPALDSAKLV